MAEIRDCNTYHDLIGLWKSGWQEFARFAESLHPVKLTPLYTSYRVGSGYKQIDETSLEGKIFCVLADALCDEDDSLGHCLGVPGGLPCHIELLNLAASSPRRPYAPADLESVADNDIQQHLKERQNKSLQGHKEHVGETKALSFPVGVLPYGGQLGRWSSNKRSFRKAMQKTLCGFVKSDTVEEALSEIASEKQWQRFIRIWSSDIKMTGRNICLESHRLVNHRAATNSRSGRISSYLRQFMELLLECLTDNYSFEEMWWRCLWVSMQPSIDILRRIENDINADIPLCSSDFGQLNRVLKQGQPHIGSVVNDRGMLRHTIVLRYRDSDEMQSLFLRMNSALLMQPAFEISQSLQKSCSDFRFKRQCQAPSCGKIFWTKRTNAVCCPGSNRGRKTKCALEWVRYTRYMDKIEKNPERDWDDVQLKRAFIEYDRD